MDRDDFDSEYDKKHGRRYSTIIFLPHARAKFRKLKISHRLLFSFVSLITSSLCLAAFFSIQYFEAMKREVYVRSSSTVALERELTDANVQMVRAHKNLEVLTQHLIREQQNREQQLREMQNRYQSLQALTQGQEKIAEAHRAILERRTLSDRLIEIGLGFSVGVLSSLVATFLWAWLKSKPLTAEEADKLNVE